MRYIAIPPTLLINTADMTTIYVESNSKSLFVEDIFSFHLRNTTTKYLKKAELALETPQVQ